MFSVIKTSVMACSTCFVECLLPSSLIRHPSAQVEGKIVLGRQHAELFDGLRPERDAVPAIVLGLATSHSPGTRISATPSRRRQLLCDRSCASDPPLEHINVHEGRHVEKAEEMAHVLRPIHVLVHRAHRVADGRTGKHPCKHLPSSPGPSLSVRRWPDGARQGGRASVVGWPSASRAQPVGIGRPALAAAMMSPRAVTEVAMSIRNGSLCR